MIKTVLCAVDITHPEDREVLQTAARLAELDDAQLDVITVVPNVGLTLVGSYFDENFQNQLVTDTQNSLKEMVGSVVGEGRNEKIRHVVTTGSIYEEILTVADQTKADLIVIGAHKPQLREFLLGPNAARVVRHSKCSVYVVRV
ncbi:universal stress protein [Labrenzia sp. PHM005]|uniref:universal stress protein n=1 Tax=Stappiaceae TaxID=2821832 RepID=UPI0011402F61|nr:universal stress protein [Labrenzia sp. PHM005]QDG78276.1 universal stress protein [Labrenzia sp. PHM005]